MYQVEVFYKMVNKKMDQIIKLNITNIIEMETENYIEEINHIKYKFAH